MVGTLGAQPAHGLIWGAPGFQEFWEGPLPLVYGHHDDAVLDETGHPRVRVTGLCHGIDTIAHGVLTSIRLPGASVVQSAPPAV